MGCAAVAIRTRSQILIQSDRRFSFIMTYFFIIDIKMIKGIYGVYCIAVARSIRSILWRERPLYRRRSGADAP